MLTIVGVSDEEIWTQDGRECVRLIDALRKGETNETRLADDIFGRPMRVAQGPMAHTPDQALPYPHYTNSYVVLRYIMAGTNRASGYAYYVYGYDYAEANDE